MQDNCFDLLIIGNSLAERANSGRTSKEGVHGMAVVSVVREHSVLQTTEVK